MSVPALTDARVGDLSTIERQSALVAQAREWLTEARDLTDVDSLRAKAATMETYARTVKASAQAITAATEIRLRAERRMGELLREEPKHPGGRPAKTPSHLTEVSTTPPTLAERGVSEYEAKSYQRLAAVPEPEFEEAIEDGKADGSLSRSRVLKAVGAERPPGPDASWLEADRFVTAAKKLPALVEPFVTAVRFGVYPTCGVGEDGNDLLRRAVNNALDQAAAAIEQARTEMRRRK